MKQKRYGFLALLAGAAILWGCSDRATEGDGSGSDELHPVLFRGSAETTDYTRADGAFPNNGQIGVIAAYYTTPGIDWTSYPDISNATATASAPTGGVYDFTWTTTKYWPFNDAQLVFLAYSPAAGTSAVRLDATHTQLELALQSPMPDVMYASNNLAAETTPYFKTQNKTVNLGEFRHVMSQVTVRVEADASMNPAVRLTALSITTQDRNATLDLLTGVLTLATAEAFTYSILTGGSVDFGATAYEQTVLLYPGTEGNTTVTVTLQDGSYSLPFTFDATDFVDDNDIPVTFERAMNTVLTITVTGTSVQNPSDTITLQGQLEDWRDAEDFGTTIK